MRLKLYNPPSNRLLKSIAKPKKAKPSPIRNHMGLQVIICNTHWIQIIKTFGSSSVTMLEEEPAPSAGNIRDEINTAPPIAGTK